MHAASTDIIAAKHVVVLEGKAIPNRDTISDGSDAIRGSA